MPAVKRFEMKTAMRDAIRQVEIRARKTDDGWESQMYMLPREGADPLLSLEEKLGTAVRFKVDSEGAALNEMMDHVKKYLKLRITD